MNHNNISYFSKIAKAAKRFTGEIRPEHKTKYAFQETIKRYQLCITTINRSIMVNVGFAFLSLYAFYIIPPNEVLNVPYVPLEISREFWLSIVPVIAYGLQLWVVTSFIWFMYLRIRLILVISERGKEDDFGEILDIYLSGVMGQIWISFKARTIFDSWLNYLWYVPAVIILMAIVFSPLIILLFFLKELFAIGEVWLGSLYAVFIVPYSIFFFAMIVAVGTLAFGEWHARVESDVDGRISLVKELSKIMPEEGSSDIDRSKDEK